jgi:hypothetical protein
MRPGYSAPESPPVGGGGARLKPKLTGRMMVRVPRRVGRSPGLPVAPSTSTVCRLTA